MLVPSCQNASEGNQIAFSHNCGAILQRFLCLRSRKIVIDPVLTQNRIGAGRAGRKQRKIHPTNGGKKHKSEPKQLRFALETTYGPEGRGFESLTAYHPEIVVYQRFQGFSFLRGEGDGTPFLIRFLTHQEERQWESLSARACLRAVSRWP